MRGVVLPGIMPVHYNGLVAYDAGLAIRVLSQSSIYSASRNNSR
jgi:hypothetical protein